MACAVCLQTKATENDKCSFCEKYVCDGCTVQCEKCCDLFCSFCSTQNYEMRYDRTFCLTCNDEEGMAFKAQGQSAAVGSNDAEAMDMD